MEPIALGLSCAEKYICWIRDGVKTVEGRVNDPKYENIKAGSLIRLFDQSNESSYVLCLVKSVNRYKTFEEMLKTEGVSNCVPETSDLEEALKIYRGFPGYEVREVKYGALAFQLQIYNQT
jgi:ASC-1-like (ASCH) protein